MVSLLKNAVASRERKRPEDSGRLRSRLAPALAGRDVLRQRDSVLFLQDLADAVGLEQTFAVGPGGVAERTTLRVVDRQAQLAHQAVHELTDGRLGGNTARAPTDLPRGIFHLEAHRRHRHRKTSFQINEASGVSNDSGSSR